MLKVFLAVLGLAIGFVSPLQAQFFASGTENEVILSFRNASDDFNVGYDLGPISAFTNATSPFALTGIAADTLAAAFGQSDLSNLRFSMAAYDLIPKVPAITDLWLTTPAAAPTPTTSGSAHNSVRTAMSTVINTYKQQGVLLGPNGRTLDKRRVTSTQWTGSYSMKMGPDPGKWGNNLAFGTEASTGPDFRDPGDRVELKLWYLPAEGGVGQPGKLLGTLTLGFNPGGTFYAVFTPYVPVGPGGGRLIFIDGETLWSTIEPAPTDQDTIQITQGGRLLVDVNQAVSKIIVIGDDLSTGSLLFDNSPRELRVTTELAFGALPGNRLDLATSAAAHRLKIEGRFLESGAGVFQAGAGTVEYAGADQRIASRIGDTPVNYMNLTLSGSGTKTSTGPVGVYGKLQVRSGTAVTGDHPVNYGSLASLEYVGTGTILTSNVEWPATMPAPVTLSGDGLVVILDATKTLLRDLAVAARCALQLGSYDLVVHGNILNNGGIGAPYEP